MTLSYVLYQVAMTLLALAYGLSHADRAMLVLLGVDLTLTAWHSAQEFDGRLWRYFGAIRGVKIPDWAGFLAFTVGLTSALWVVAILALAFGQPWALGLLLGARMGDWWSSHAHLEAIGYRPNPGFGTAMLFPIETLIVFFASWDVVQAGPAWMLLGCLGGAASFASILPALGLLRHWPDFGQPRWRRGDEIPLEAT
jgi:hypothetical protein